MCKWLASIWNEIMSFLQQQLLKYRGIWYACFFGRFETKKTICILVISVMSNIFECQNPDTFALTFQQWLSRIQRTTICTQFSCFLNHFKFLQMSDILILLPWLACYSHANFTYSFPRLTIISIPTKTEAIASHLSFFLHSPPHARDTTLMWHRPTPLS